MISLQAFALTFMAMGLTSADFHSSVSDVESNAHSIQTKVDGWSASQGLLAALSIQSAFSGLNNAVTSLSTAANSAQDSEIQVGEIENLATAINSLLSSLSKKSSDFKQVGAQTIVANDISALSKPTLDIINNLIKAVSSDCTKGSSLQPALIHIGASFNLANSAFGLQKMNFPTTVPCNSRKESQNSFAPAEIPSSAIPMRPASSINTPTMINSDAPLTVYSTKYANGPSPSSIAVPSSVPAPPQVPGPGLGPESEASNTPLPPILSKGPQSGLGPALPSAILPPSLASDSVTASDPSMWSSSLPVAEGSQNALPPAPYLDRNSTFTQASVIISNGANTISHNALLVALAVIPSVTALL